MGTYERRDILSQEISYRNVHPKFIGKLEIDNIPSQSTDIPKYMKKGYIPKLFFVLQVQCEEKVLTTDVGYPLNNRQQEN